MQNSILQSMSRLSKTTARDFLESDSMKNLKRKFGAGLKGVAFYSQSISTARKEIPELQMVIKACITSSIA
jgi:hypothetical protein